jgi:hypothetical protein
MGAASRYVCKQEVRDALFVSAQIWTDTVDGQALDRYRRAVK